MIQWVNAAATSEAAEYQDGFDQQRVAEHGLRNCRDDVRKRQPRVEEVPNWPVPEEHLLGPCQMHEVIVRKSTVREVAVEEAGNSPQERQSGYRG
jgi:hypothetical protein